VRLAIPLALDDAASEDDVFEIEDREIFIFQFFGGVEGYDMVQRANQVAYSGDRESWHTGNSTGARLRCNVHVQRRVKDDGGIHDDR